MDSEGNDAIGYPSFTMLSEENWKKINVNETFLKGKMASELGSKKSEGEASFLSKQLENLQNEYEKHDKLEQLGR